jgi:hypothetical protein
LKGDAYLKLSNYEIALANYNRVVTLGYPTDKRDNLQQQWNDTLRREEERAEAEAV